MSLRRLPILCCLVLLSGCLYHAQERTDETVAELAAHPFDLGPPEPAKVMPHAEDQAAAKPKGSTARPILSLDTEPVAALDVQTTAFMQAPQKTAEELLKLPPDVPGSETPPQQPDIPVTGDARKRAILELYPDLPPPPTEPAALPGPNGRPYTLADLQQLAAANSPVLRQAASDVEAAKGALIQAQAYPNPFIGWAVSPSNDGSTPGVQGITFGQVVRTGGKQKLQVAAAEVAVRNAELALKRARSDLSTQVRAAYFALLVARETVRVNKALVEFTDEVYRFHTNATAGAAQFAAHEPAALRAQAYTARLAYKQAIQGYIYAWEQMVATVGLRHLPLTEVAGRIDAAIPYYDYDTVLAYALRNHTDVLTARNSLAIARYNLMTQQVTPIPDVTFNVLVQKEFVLPPQQWVPSATVTFPIPIWDQNKGNIISAEAAQVRASEEPHRVEVTMTSSLATAYANYKSNLDALEYYRRYILPDQVRYYRGVFRTHHILGLAGFGDLVAAQQTLYADVISYLGVLGQLWTSVVTVADFLQTDDLFQLATPQQVPELPDLEHLPPWACPHPAPVGPAVQGPCTLGPSPPSQLPLAPGRGGEADGTPMPPVLPAPRPVTPAPSSSPTARQERLGPPGQ